MRRKDRELSRAEAEKLLEKCEYGVLSLIDSGVPYAIPVSFVYESGKIHIHCATVGKKLDCIDKNPNAVFTVVGETRIMEGRFSTLYESAIASGTASLVSKTDEKRNALINLCKKYYPETETKESEFNRLERYINENIERTAVIQIDVLSVTGKANKG